MKEKCLNSLGSLPSSDWLQRKLAQLKQERAEFRQTPATGGQLLRYLAKPATASPKEKEFEKLLSLIVNDVLDGVDISRRYPAFFEQLVADVALRESFLDILEILELSRAGQLEPLPGEPSYDLSFLHKQSPHPIIEMAETGRWRVGYQQTAAEIETLFTTFWNQSDEGPYRGTGNYFDDDHIILMRDKVTVDGEQYEVLLEAKRPVDEPEQLNLLLLVTTERPPSAAMQASVQWGSYQASLTLNDYGLGRFTPVPLTAILDEDGQTVAEDLHLEFGPAMNFQKALQNP